MLVAPEFQREFMIKTVAVVFAGLVLIQNPLSAAEFRSIARVGLDSNAFELSDGLSPTEEEFGVAGLYSKSSAFDWLHWDVKAEKSFISMTHGATTTKPMWNSKLLTTLLFMT